MLNVDAREKLKGLLPPGVVATKKWLLNQGFNPHFVDNAVRSKTLLPLVSGVFCQFSKQLNWKGVVASLQRMRDEPVHLGGLSALELAGLAHYASQGRQVHLYSARSLPGWLSRLDLNTEFVGHGTKTLWPDNVMSEGNYVKQEDWREGLPSLIFSCAEKAMLEVLADVPKKISFEHADQLMQSLQNLSPNRLDALLLACINIKVKRLFFWLAERHQLSWLKKLDADRYDFGSGKRLIETEGRFDSKWLITVPKNM